MWLQILVICGFVIAWASIIYLSSKVGSKSAELEAIKAELKKQEQERNRAERINDTIGRMSDDDVRNRLHEIAGKQR